MARRPASSCRELRGALQHVDVGRARGDFCVERFRVDCARLEEELRLARKASAELQQRFVKILESEEQPHCTWLTRWHQRLLAAVSEAESVQRKRSSVIPGWKDFKQLVLRSTEEVVQSQQLVEQKVAHIHGQLEGQSLKEELQERRKELAELLAQRKSCAEEVQKKKLQQQKSQREAAEEEKRWGKEKEAMLKQKSELGQKVEDLAQVVQTTSRSNHQLTDEIQQLRKMRRPMPLHVYKLRMEKLKAELVEWQQPLLAAEKARRSREVEQQTRHFQEMEELRILQTSLKRKLAQVHDGRRASACRPIQKFWRQRQRRQEVARRSRYFEEIAQATVEVPGLAPRTPGASPETASVIEDRSASTDLAEDLVAEVRRNLLPHGTSPESVGSDSPGGSSGTGKSPADSELEEGIPAEPAADDREHIGGRDGMLAASERVGSDSPGGSSGTGRSPADSELEEGKPTEPAANDGAERTGGRDGRIAVASECSADSGSGSQEGTVDDEVEEESLNLEVTVKKTSDAQPDPTSQTESSDVSPGGKSRYSEEGPLDDEVEEDPTHKVPENPTMPDPSNEMAAEESESSDVSPGGKSRYSEEGPLDDEVEEEGPKTSEQTEESSGSEDDVELAQSRWPTVPQIALHPPNESAGDGFEGTLASQELQGEFLSMTFTSADGAKGPMEDSLLLTEESPGSPDREPASFRLPDEEKDPGTDPEKTSGQQTEAAPVPRDATARHMAASLLPEDSDESDESDDSEEAPPPRPAPPKPLAAAPPPPTGAPRMAAQAESESDDSDEEEVPAVRSPLAALPKAAPKMAAAKAAAPPVTAAKAAPARPKAAKAAPVRRVAAQDSSDSGSD